METHINIGGIGIGVEIPARFGGNLLGKAYRPFMRPADGESAVSGMLRVAALPASEHPGRDIYGEAVATGFNDLGESRLFFDGMNYTVGISPAPGLAMRYMTFSASFRSATLYLMPGDSWNSFILDSMLRIFFSQVAVNSSAFLIHASAVVTPAGAHLFMGRSGTGKSTHASMWLGSFHDTLLLNDDNPLVMIDREGAVAVSGTPWSGKTPCWRDIQTPLLSMTRLRQSPENKYTPLADVEAFVAVMPGVSAIAHSRQLYDSACITLGSIVERVRVGILDCRPDAGAAHVCRTALQDI